MVIGSIWSDPSLAQYLKVVLSSSGMYKADENFCVFSFSVLLQMGVEGTDEGASGAQHSRKLVSFTLSGKKRHYSLFYKLLLKKM